MLQPFHICCSLLCLLCVATYCPGPVTFVKRPVASKWGTNGATAWLPPVVAWNNPEISTNSVWNSRCLSRGGDSIL